MKKFILMAISFLTLLTMFGPANAAHDCHCGVKCACEGCKCPS